MLSNEAQFAPISYQLADRAVLVHNNCPWQRADQLNPGDQLGTTSQRAVRVVGLRPGTRPTAIVYNLAVPVG